MTVSFQWLAVTALIFALFFEPQPSQSCAIVGPQGSAIGMAFEEVIIIWDQQAKRQHLIRNARFNTGVPDFGFLVPTPTLPEISRVEATAFWVLSTTTAPRTEFRKIPARLGLKSDKATVAAVPGSVSVFLEDKIGDYDVAVVKSTDAMALAAWLRKHNYVSSPELTRWTKIYLDQGWFITAFKVTKTPDPLGMLRMDYSPIRMSFDTPSPFFPYREPKQSAIPLASPRLFKLFFIGDSKVEAKFGPQGGNQTPMYFSTVWANNLADDVLQQVAKHAAIPEATQSNWEKKKWYLTEFADNSVIRIATDDLEFPAATDQSPLARAPTIVYIESWEPYYTYGAILVVVTAIVVFIAVKLTRVYLFTLPGAPLDPWKDS